MTRMAFLFLAVISQAIFQPAFAADAPLTLDNPPGWPESPKAPRGAPNIVLIMLDDAGYAATSMFGGPAQTPALEQLASRGLRYNRFHVASMCVNTRAALLSGRNEHHIGFGGFTAGYPGYNGIWKKDSVAIPDVLRRNGYSTAAFGKWHNTPTWETSPVGPFDHWPTGLGFEYFYGFMGGLDSHWEPSLLYRNTTPVDPPSTPSEAYYLTKDLVEDAIGWLHTQRSLAPQKPYFLYFAPGATHTPHHVARSWVEKYRGQFDGGWDKLRAVIFARQKELGVIPANAELTPRPKELPSWNSLPADERKYLARQMEVYAAFMSQTDYEVGRLLEAVQREPGGDNTLVLYIVGDNGASAGGGIHGADNIMQSSHLIEHALQHMPDLGDAHFLNEFAASWAWALSTPYQWEKTVASHLGGTRNPLVVSWPGHIKDQGGLRTQFTHVNDIAATLYDVAGISFPETVDGVKQIPLDGTSFARTFEQANTPSQHRVQVFEFSGNRAIYEDGWVAAARHTLGWGSTPDRDYARDQWELYNLDTDFSQAHDLAKKNPDKLKQLQELFDSEAKRNLIYPLGAGANFPARPAVTPGKTQLVFHPDFPRVPSSAVPNFARSHRISAEIVIPPAGAEGIIASNGNRFGGFAFYVKDGRLVYEINFAGDSSAVITSEVALPTGRSEVAYEFVRENAVRQALIDASGAGIGRLYINGKLVAERELSHGVAVVSGSFNVGREGVSPVSTAYHMPFAFTGTLEKVEIALK